MRLYPLNGAESPNTGIHCLKGVQASAWGPFKQ